jgi:hypothetical protein
MAAVVNRGEVVRRIIERTDIDQFTERVLDSFWETDEFQRFQPPRDRVREWVRWNLDLVNRWLIEGRPPTDSELETFRAHARDRAAEGIPGDVIPANFRRAARFAWGALLDAATDAERPALLDSADLLFEYVDRVSRIYFEESAGVRRASPGRCWRGSTPIRRRFPRITSSPTGSASTLLVHLARSLSRRRGVRPSTTSSSPGSFAAGGRWRCRKAAVSSGWR